MQSALIVTRRLDSTSIHIRCTPYNPPPTPSNDVMTSEADVWSTYTVREIVDHGGEPAKRPIERFHQLLGTNNGAEYQGQGDRTVPPTPGNK